MEAKDFEQFKLGDVITVTSDEGEKWIIDYRFISKGRVYADAMYCPDEEYWVVKNTGYFVNLYNIKSVERTSADDFTRLCDILNQNDVHYVILDDRRLLIEMGTDKMSLIENGAKAFEGITQEMVDLHSRKNNDYGNAYQEMLDFAGIDAGIGIMYNKLKRLKTLVSIGERQVKEESIEDTLIDLANYSVMTLEYIRNKK